MKRWQWILPLCVAVTMTSCDSGDDLIPPEDAETEAQARPNPTEKPLSIPGKKTQKAPPKTELEKKLIGTWEGINDAGQKGTMELTNDGKCILLINGSKSQMNWEFNVPDEKTIEFLGVVGGKEMAKKFPVTVDGDTLVIIDRGKKSRFTRVK